MKKFISILIIFIFLFSVNIAKADLLALSSKSINYYGIGVINFPEDAPVYELPDKNSKVILDIDFEKQRKSSIVNSNKIKKVSYITYIPSKDIALLAVEENPQNGWYNIYINQKTGKTGWIYTEKENIFYTYKSLFYKYGKKYGVRMFNDIPKDKKILYAKETTESKRLEQLKFPKHMGFTIIRGNWMLTTVNDMASYAKVGWFEWRNEDGTLNVFPNFK